jgi:RHS repeat-associated protein
VNGNITLSAYLGNYFEWSGSTSTMKKYYSAGSLRLAMRTGSGTGTTGLLWLLGDHLGSTSKAANPNGTLYSGSEQRYKPWGEKRFPAGSSTAPTTYRYTGQRQEKDLGGVDGLYFYQSRWYDPALGRWLSPDTIVPEGVQGTQAWDRYAYSNNSPVVYSDPTGHWIESLLDIASIAYDIYDISQNGLNWETGLALAADVGGLILPGVTGGGLAVRALTHADEAVDAVRAVNTAGNLAQAANQADNLTDALTHVDDLPNNAYVCRGGTCTAERFAGGSGVTINPDGTLSGVSVNSAPGFSVQELTQNIPNNQVGVTTVGDVRAAGGNVIPQPLFDNPYHAYLSGITPSQAENLFTPTIRNPNRGR